MKEKSIKDLRQSVGITQNELAELIGTNRKRIYLLEVGQAKPSPEERTKLCMTFHCSEAELDVALDLAVKEGKKKKQHVIRFRPTDEQYEKIVENAKRCNMKIGTYVAKTYDGGELKIIEGLEEFTIQLRRIGVNLNQLTKLSHAGKVRTPDLKAIQITINEIYVKLNRMLG